MNTTRAAIAIAAGALVVAPAAILSATGAEPEPVVVEPLTPRSDFTDVVSIGIDVALDGEAAEHYEIADPSLVVVARVTAQPGARLPWHVHDGPVLITVTEGAIVYVEGDCTERHYQAGTTFIDPGGGFVHTIYNPGEVVTVLTSTFFQVPAEGPLSITEGVAAPACDAGSQPYSACLADIGEFVACPGFDSQ